MGNVFLDIYQSTLNVDQIVGVINGFEQFSSLDESDLLKLPEYAAVIARNINVSPTQLRRFYSYVKSIEIANRKTKEDVSDFKDKYKLKFILPKIAGSSERDKLKVLYKVLDACLNGGKINTVKDLRVFMEFFEAILDYHTTVK